MRGLKEGDIIEGKDKDEPRERKKKKKDDGPDAAHEWSMTQQLKQEREAREVKRLQQEAGLIGAAQAERIDWLYEQGVQITDEELMNTMVDIDKQNEIAKYAQLKSEAGALFLDSASTASHDTLRKLREDPMFAIRQEEQRQQAALEANPLYLARQRAKEAHKMQKAQAKKEKKERKEAKKVMKEMKKAGTWKSPEPERPARRSRSRSPKDRRERRPDRRSRSRDRRRSRSRSRSPNVGRTQKRASLSPERFRRTGPREVQQRGAAGTDRRGGVSIKAMSQEDRERAFREMKQAGLKHERSKDERATRIDAAEKAKEELEEELRKKSQNSGAGMMHEVKAASYLDENQTLADRLSNQKSRRMRTGDLFDPLER